MKKFNLFLLLTVIMLTLSIVNCNGQPKNDYEIVSSPVTGATTYNFFLEKKSANPYQLVQGMDYLAPSVIALKVGTSTTPLFTVNLVNDASEYRVGVVAQNVAGFYSGMGIATGVVGTVPTVPAGIIFRKK